ncbi:MAG TPA: 50S ribosomal protein L3 [Planctomycetota bacterium]|nr:50S ribosomal protein L3 [Planctomycetota bacterium]
MTIGILGKKLGMTSLFREDGTQIPVTVIQAGPCKVTQVKVKEISELPEDRRTAVTNLGKRRGKIARERRPDGYYAVQLAFDPRPERTESKAVKGHLAKAGATPAYFLREIRWSTLPPYKEGDELNVQVLKDIDRVDVTGVTKGRGFAGTIKRYGFHRQAQGHGNSRAHRRPGSNGRNFSISKGVPKGRRRAGHFGVEVKTQQNLEIVKLDEGRNLLYVRGAIPGHRNGYVIVRKTVKTKG